MTVAHSPHPDQPTPLVEDGVNQAASLVECMKSIFTDYEEFSKIPVRIIDCKDPASATRLEWLSHIFQTTQIFDFNLPDAILVSSATSDFEVIIFSGEDYQRIGHCLKINAPLLVDKAKIWLCAKSDPRRRAKLLSGGFDDAIDISRTDPIEFLSRIYSIWSRYIHNARDRIKNSEIEAELDKYSFSYDLKPRQKIILSKLIQSPDFSSTTFALRNAVSPYQEIITLDHLKVIVSALRKHLRPGIRIVYHDSLYQLQVKAK
jgi:hypothetical protein